MWSSSILSMRVAKQRHHEILLVNNCSAHSAIDAYDVELSRLKGSYVDSPNFHLRNRQCLPLRIPGIQRRA